MGRVIGRTIESGRSAGCLKPLALAVLAALMIAPGNIAPFHVLGSDEVLGVAHALESRSDAGRDVAQAVGQRSSEKGMDDLINPDGFTSARVCGSCHSDIYNTWKNSLHAFSLTDPIFDAAYMQALKEGGEEAKRMCLRCHAPMTLMNGDFDLEQGVTREGVSCDFCHTVTDVHLDNPERPYSLDLGLVKRSVLKKASSPSHEVAYSELHGTAEFCGGCHNYVAPSGASIMSTYDEWAKGPYAEEGVQCQNCHMVLSEGDVVSASIQKSASEIHLHNLIHDTDQLRSAMEVRVLTAKRTAHGLNVEVEVENVGSGHMVPTGMPSREVVLNVSVEADGDISQKERRYRKVVADEKGRPLKRDFEILLRGARVLTDNRIAPREKRQEGFRFDVPQTGSVKVKATLSYIYSPMVLDQRQLNIKLSESEKVVF
jgi:hypothetical protein